MPSGDGRFGPSVEVRPLFPRERVALLELLASLTAEQWEIDTVPGWTVKDLVAHVLHDHLRRLSAARDGHQAPLPPGSTLAERINAANEAFVAVARQLSTTLLVDLLAHVGPQLDEVWDAMDPNAPASVDVSWAGDGTPTWLDVAREYTELWVHQQQVREAVRRPGFNGPDALNPVVATFARALPFTLHPYDRPVGTAVTLRVTGPAGGTWTATRQAHGWGLTDPGPAQSAAGVVIDQDTFWRLATRMVEVERARARAELWGDLELAAAMTTLLAIVR